MAAETYFWRPRVLYGTLESNLIWQDKNESAGSPDRNSGGTIWYLPPGLFDRPTDIAVDIDGNVYVVDFGNNRIQKFSPDKR